MAYIHPKAWDDAWIAYLREAHATGATMVAIAGSMTQKFRRFFSKGMVVGKVHRLGLNLRPCPAAVAKRRNIALRAQGLPIPGPPSRAHRKTRIVVPLAPLPVPRLRKSRAKPQPTALTLPPTALHQLRPTLLLLMASQRPAPEPEPEPKPEPVVPPWEDSPEPAASVVVSLPKWPKRVRTEAQRKARQARERAPTPAPVALHKYTCQFANDKHVGQPGFAFCGKPSWACEDPEKFDASKSTVWCRYHHSIVYIGKPQRREAA